MITPLVPPGACKLFMAVASKLRIYKPVQDDPPITAYHTGHIIQQFCSGEPPCLIMSCSRLRESTSMGHGFYSFALNTFEPKGEQYDDMSKGDHVPSPLYIVTGYGRPRNSKRRPKLLWVKLFIRIT